MAHSPVNVGGTGPHTVVLRVSEDAFLGDARFNLLVDGQQVGSTQTAHALHGSGQSDTVTVQVPDGQHNVGVRFLNDLWGGSASRDRNLYVDAVSYDGQTVPNAPAALLGTGDTSRATVGMAAPPPPTSTAPTPAPAGATTTIGSGSDTLVLRVSQDAYQGSAQYTVSVDGVQINGTLTAQALHGSGQSDTVNVLGNWAAGNHTATVNFLNDAWGGTAATDRNLYVDSATYDGAAVAGAARSLPSNGPATFGFTDGTAAPPPPASSGFGKVVFSDEFNGTSLDGSKWPITYDGNGLYWNGAFRWERDELSVSGGSLHIGLTKQADGIWTVGGLITTPSSWAPGFGFTNGKVEIRAKVDQEVVGAGPVFLLWPATNDHWPPEVDILETPNAQGMFTNHWQGPGGNNDDRYEAHHFDLDSSQWHTYGLEWTPNRLTMTVDGGVVKTLTGNIPREAMSVGLQGHIGAAGDGWYGGSPNGSGVSHVDIAVDYVRVSEWIG